VAAKQSKNRATLYGHSNCTKYSFHKKICYSSLEKRFDVQQSLDTIYYNINVKMATSRPTFLTITAQALYSDQLKTSHNEFESLQQTVKDNLDDISVYFARILKHTARAKVDMANADEDWRNHYLETLQTDIEKLRRLSYELGRVHTTHPYCAGCNDPAGFQPNQMAHTCGHEDSDSDEED